MRDDDTAQRAVRIPVEPWRKRCVGLGMLSLFLWMLTAALPWIFPSWEPAGIWKWFKAIEPYTPYRYSPQAGFKFNDVAFFDKNTGFGVGDKGVILHTEDGGRSWNLANNVTWVRSGTIDLSNALMPEKGKEVPPPELNKAKGASLFSPADPIRALTANGDRSEFIRVENPATQRPVENLAVEQIQMNVKQAPPLPTAPPIDVKQAPPLVQEPVKNAQAPAELGKEASATTPAPLTPPPFADGSLPESVTMYEIKFADDASSAWAIGVVQGRPVLIFSKDAGKRWTGIYLERFETRSAPRLEVNAASEAWAMIPATETVLIHAETNLRVEAWRAPLSLTLGIAAEATGSLFAYGSMDHKDTSEYGASQSGALASLTKIEEVTSKPIYRIEEMTSKPIYGFDPDSGLMLDGDLAILLRGTDGPIRYVGRLADAANTFAAADNKRVWAFGVDTTFRTNDGGNTWSAVPELANVIRLGFRKKIGWAIKSKPPRGNQLLVSTDDGETWSDPRRYTRLPSLISWMFFLVGLGLVAPAFFQKPPPTPEALRKESIANFYLSDAPLEDLRAATDDMAALASGIARFLRNENTGAPLVLGVCGPWGSGKSSLMNLIRARLSDRGFQSVWFNAWHHEQEQHLLAALLQNIREQAIPPVFSWHGLFYRVELAKRRFSRRWAYVSVMLVIIALLIGFASGSGVAMEGLDFHDATALFTSVLGLLPLGAVAAPVLALVRLLGAFGIDPGKLALSAAAGANASDLRDLTSFRYRFAVEFGEVTHALKPKRMVIFIDDLDRCQADHMMTMLETINFLASSGECFVVLSMEKRAVLACLAQKLTGWTEQYKQAFGDGEKAPTPADYAGLWLEKLVQVEVSVPTMTRAEMQQVAGAIPAPKRADDEVQPAGWRQRLVGIVNLQVAVAIAAVILLAAGASWFGFSRGAKVGAAKEKPPEKPPQTWFIRGAKSADGNTFDFTATDRAPSEGAVAKTAPTPASTSTNIRAGATQVIVLGPPPVAKAADIAHVGVTAAARSFAYTLIIVSSLLIAVLTVVPALKRLMRFYEGVTKDSERFREAVTTWWDTIERLEHTPRSIKRFINRLRLYASLVRKPQEAEGEPLVSERTIVGFGVMEEACPAALRQRLNLFEASEDPTIASRELSQLGPLQTEAEQVLSELTGTQRAEAVRRLSSALRM